MADRNVVNTATLDTLRTTYNSTAADVGDIASVTGASGVIGAATDIIEAITGCYYGLQDNDNYMKFQGVLDERNLPTLIEKYKRGRRKSKLTDEYILGEVIHEENIEVPADDSVELDFELPFEFIKSDMDSWQGRNFVLGSIVKTAKFLKGVRSEFRIEVDAKVKGTALNPFARETVTFS